MRTPKLPDNAVVFYMASDPAAKPCLVKIVRRNGQLEAMGNTAKPTGAGSPTLRAACIGLLLAKARKLDPSGQSVWHELVSGAGTGTWAASFVQNTSASKGWWEKLAKHLRKEPKLDFFLVGEHTEKGKRFTIRYDQAENFWEIDNIVVIRGDRILGTVEEHYDFAAELEASHPNWRKSRLIPLPEGRLLPEAAQTSIQPATNQPSPPQPAFAQADLAHLANIRPDTRALFAACQKKKQDAAVIKKAVAGFTGEERADQRAFAEVHRKIEEWRITTGWTPADRLPNQDDFKKLKAIAPSSKRPLPLPLPLLFDLAWEFAGTLEKPSADGLPPLHHGHRSFPLREADETAALLVPLLEVLDPQTGQPLASPRAFRGWLKVERVPVPCWQDGDPLWKGGKLYPAPAFALLDTDPDWRAALENAEAHARTLNGGELRTDADFRWSLERDGKALPPVLLGNHGAAFALTLAKLCHRPGFGHLRFEGVCVMAGIQANGDLVPCPPADAELLLAAACLPAVPATIAVVGPKLSANATPVPPECHLLEAGSLTAAAAAIAKDAERYQAVGTDPLPPPEGFQLRPELDTLLALPRRPDAPPSGSIVIIAQAGTGKTTWLSEQIRRRQVELAAPIFHIIPNRFSATRDSIARSLCLQLQRKYGLPPPVAYDGNGLMKLLEKVSGQLPKDGHGRVIPEILFVEAADQVREAQTLLSGLFRPELQPGIWCVFTTRPDQHWRDTNENVRLYSFLTGRELDRGDPQVTTEEIPTGEHIQTYRNAVRNYLHWANRQFHLGLTADFITAICNHPAPPLFLTVSERVQRIRALMHEQRLVASASGQAELDNLRQNTGPWLLDADDRAKEIANHLETSAVQKWGSELGEGVARQRPWQVLGLTLLAEVPVSSDDLDRWVSDAEGQFPGLEGMEKLREFCRRHGDTVLREARNLFRSRPLDAPRDRRDAFGHPSYERLVRDRLRTGPARRECAALLAAAALGRWRKEHADPPGHEHWTLTHLPRLLRESERWDDLLALLNVPQLPLAKQNAGLTTSLVTDYDETARFWPARRAAPLEEREQLAELIVNEALRPVERAAAGRLLARLGDPRRGVGVVKDGKGNVLPDIQFTDVELPAVKGATDKVAKVGKPKPYRMAKFPVTVGQFAEFARGGYDNEKYWEEAIAAKQWRRKDGKGEVKDWQRGHNWWRGASSWGKEYEHGNQPVGGVNWYECTAFCSWFTEQLQARPDLWPAGWDQEKHGLPVVKLPHEAEWEQAAQWDGRKADGRKYPWGKEGTDAELGERCNCHHSGIRSTSAVGLFPRGKGACGAYDLSGNVWEWCENFHDNDNVARVLRGGGWFDDGYGLLSSAWRFVLGPDPYFNGYGFRCVVVGGSFR